MKVDLKLDRSKPLNFEGYKVDKNAIGAREYHFNYPFNSADFDCYLELFSVAQDKNNNYYVTDILSNFYNDNNEIKVEPGVGVKVDLASRFTVTFVAYNSAIFLSTASFAILSSSVSTYI